jgi:hypothetical protein
MSPSGALADTQPVLIGLSPHSAAGLAATPPFDSSMFTATGIIRALPVGMVTFYEGSISRSRAVSCIRRMIAFAASTPSLPSVSMRNITAENV